MEEIIKIRQFQLENEAAQRLLQFLLQENALLKARLAGVLRVTTITGDALVLMEQYHEKLLQKDEVIGFMRQDAAAVEKMLVRYVHTDGGMGHLLQCVHKMRKDLKELGMACLDLKTQFNAFIESILE